MILNRQYAPDIVVVVDVLSQHFLLARAISWFGPYALDRHFHPGGQTDRHKDTHLGTVPKCMQMRSKGVVGQ